MNPQESMVQSEKIYPECLTRDFSELQVDLDQLYQQVIELVDFSIEIGKQLRMVVRSLEAQS